MSLSTRVLDTRVSEWSRKRGPGGEIGVEVELEGTLHTGDLANRFWIVKPEGSLREGYEYVLAKPTKLSELIAVGKEFDGMMEKSRPKKTIRCSTHIHVNVNNKTIRQLYNIIGYYYLVEELLVRTQGPVRTGNLFCLRMSDAEDIGDQLVYSAEEHHITCFNQSNNKYGALNLAAPIKFGSLEFRFLLPMTSWKEIDFWVGLLHQMVNTAENLSIRDAVRFVETDSPKKFLSRGQRLVEILKQDEMKPYSFFEQIILLFLAQEGFFDLVELQDVAEKKKSVLLKFIAQGSDLKKLLTESKELTTQLKQSILSFFHG